MSAYLVISLEGVIGVIITSVLLLILNKIECPYNSILCNREDSTNHSVENFKETFAFIFTYKEYTIGFIIFMIGIFCYNTFRLKTNEAYSPTHQSIATSIGSCLSWILKLCIPYFQSETNFFWFNLSKGIAYVIIIFGVSVFLEIIIINKCGLNQYTAKVINRRSVFVSEKEKEELGTIYKKESNELKQSALII